MGLGTDARQVRPFTLRLREYGYFALVTISEVLSRSYGRGCQIDGDIDHYFENLFSHTQKKLHSPEPGGSGQRIFSLSTT